MLFRRYEKNDIKEMTRQWNIILEDGVAFPGTELYEENSFEKMLEEQTEVRCMIIDDKIAGFYILHPNNIGRCSHVANASFILDPSFRGQHLGHYLVEDCIAQAIINGYRGMQFNAVVDSNKAALHIYEKCGFTKVGTIPGGFLLKDGTYSDMHILYLSLI